MIRTFYRDFRAILSTPGPGYPPPPPPLAGRELLAFRYKFLRWSWLGNEECLVGTGWISTSIWMVISKSGSKSSGDRHKYKPCLFQVDWGRWSGAVTAFLYLMITINHNKQQRETIIVDRSNSWPASKDVNELIFSYKICIAKNLKFDWLHKGMC
jgi:hypothetical protein